MKHDNAKRTAQQALKSEYGFCPALADIDVVSVTEKEGRPIFIIFYVHGKEYYFDSYLVHFGDTPSVWVGKGTITKKN